MDALLEISGSGRTADPFYIRLEIARAINRAHGGAVISVWEVDDLDDATVDHFHLLETALPQMRQGRKRVEALFAKWKQRHARRQ